MLDWGCALVTAGLSAGRFFQVTVTDQGPGSNDAAHLPFVPFL
jgi:hypothetical protein